MLLAIIFNIGVVSIIKHIFVLRTIDIASIFYKPFIVDFLKRKLIDFSQNSHV